LNSFEINSDSVLQEFKKRLQRVEPNTILPAIQEIFKNQINSLKPQKQQARILCRQGVQTGMKNPSNGVGEDGRGAAMK
jgi:hypothetical protein